jgi:hypothetical protein
MDKMALVLLLSLSAGWSGYGEEVGGRAVGVARILGQEYELAERTTNRGTGYTMSEYTRPGETLESWGRLVTLHDYPKMDRPEEYIKNMAKLYAEQNPRMEFETGGDETRGEFWMDAIFVGDGRKVLGEGAGAVEWSFFRAVPNGGGTRVLQYSERRVYNNSPKEVFDTWELGSLRKKLLPQLISEKIP